REAARAPQSLPDLAAPYFGHMRVRSGGRVRGALLGGRAPLDAARDVTPGDWRRAPLAGGFFTCDPGDDYEIEVDGRTIEGELLERRLVAFENGELFAISTGGGSLVRSGGQWRREPDRMVPRLAGAPIDPEARGVPRMVSLLDE